MSNREALIQRVAARNFRNYTQTEVTLSPRWTVVSGLNGAGKTNFLEMVVLNLRGVSFRGKLSELLRWETKETKIVTNLRGALKITTNIFFSQGKIKHERLLDGRSAVQLEDAAPPLVLFLPQEEFLLDSAGGRRKILSRGLILQSQTYRLHFGQYLRLLKQRNALLRAEDQNGTDLGQLNSWTEALLEPMLHIWTMRRKFTRMLNEKLPGALKKVGGINLPLRAELVFGGLAANMKEVTAEVIFSRFTDMLERERLLKTTLVGPHRDSFRFVADGRDVLSLLSRGQRRLLLLALHLIEGEYAAASIGTEPLYVLDDIFSELDQKHRNAIGEALANNQVIATTADKIILPRLPTDAMYYEVEKGELNETQAPHLNNQRSPKPKD